MVVQDKIGLESGIRQVRQLYGGDHFGEISMLYNCRRSATVVANNYCTLARLTPSDFKDITSKFPSYLQHLKEQVYLYDDPIKLFLEEQIKRIPYFHKIGVDTFHDVLFNFNTAYLDDTRWVISRPRIAVTYLQGWFWIDVPSSVPVELIDMFVEGDNDHLAMLRFLRLFRLLRLLRLLKVRLRLLRCFVIALIARASHPTTHDCCTDLRLLRPLALRTVSLRWENTLQRLRSNLTST